VRGTWPAIESTVIIVTLAVLLAAGCAGQGIKPTFQWDSTYASPGKALTLSELSRQATSKGTKVFYRIRATGFTAADNPALWLQRGTEYQQLPVILTDAGVVQVDPGVDEFAVLGFVSGQPLDLALVAIGSGERAQAKVVPFPIEARGQGGCFASAELESEKGRLFLITLHGFGAGESVHVEDRFGTEVVSGDHVASPQGELQFPILFGPFDNGEATLTATSIRCSVTLTYRVGKNAIDSP